MIDHLCFMSCSNPLNIRRNVAVYLGSEELPTGNREREDPVSLGDGDLGSRCLDTYHPHQSIRDKVPVTEWSNPEDCAQSAPIVRHKATADILRYPCTTLSDGNRQKFGHKRLERLMGSNLTWYEPSTQIPAFGNITNASHATSSTSSFRDAGSTGDKVSPGLRELDTFRRLSSCIVMELYFLILMEGDEKGYSLASLS